MYKAIKKIYYRKNVITLILKNDIQGLKNYLSSKHIKLRNIENEFNSTKTNFLLFSIEHDASIKMIEYIIEECEYETLNFGKHAYHSPLFKAILKGNFELANFLIENGADINYKHFDMDEKNFFRFVYRNSPCFKKALIFLLSQGFMIDPMNIHCLINSKATYNNIALETIFQYSVYNSNFILNLLSYYRTRKPLSNEVLKNLIEKNKIIITNNMYEAAIHNKNYEAIRILHKYSDRPKDVNLGYIFGFFESFDTRNKKHRKKDFSDSIIRNKLNLGIDKQVLESISNSEKIREDIKCIILNGNLQELKRYISEMTVSNVYLNNNEFDLLIFAIENQPRLKMIKYIISQYSTLNYFIMKDGIIYTTPLSLAIYNENFMIADELLRNKADLNYPIFNLNFFDSYENAFDFLYKRKLCNQKRLIYIFNNNIHITPTIIYQLIYNNELKILTLMFQYYLFNNLFILEFLSISKNRKPLSDRQLRKKIEKERNKIKFNSSMYEKAIINGFYHVFIVLLDNDHRGSNLVLNDIFKVLHSKGFDREKQVFQNNIKKYLYLSNSSLCQELLINLDNIPEKRKAVLEKIRNNDVKALKTYLENNKIMFFGLNCYENDILIDSIENDVSYEMIEFILNYYKTLNYVNFNGQYKTPLLLTISKNNFKLANLLLKKHAHINYTINKENKQNLFYYLCHYNMINKKNVMYVIRNGIDISFYAINLLMKNSSTSILKIIYRHYIFNNQFIIKFLTIYKKRIVLSNKTLNKIISKEKGKLFINEMYFKESYKK